MVPRIQEPPREIATAPLAAGPNDHLHESSDYESPHHPGVLRAATAPEPRSVVAAIRTPLIPASSFHPRNSSPFRKTHVRSKSSASSLSAPQMARAHSLPGSEAAERMLAPLAPTSVRPSSPLGPPGRHRSPLRKSSDEPYFSCADQIDIGETISENSELHLTPRTTANGDGMPASPSFSMHNTFPRVRRRPSSPFHPGLPSNSRATLPASVLRTSNSSPSLSAAKFNEPYPLNYSFSSSSIPSTPTSFRSRSPSISSLETIPDTPDAELEAENIALLKAAVDKENELESHDIIRRRASGEMMGRPDVMRDKGKRWSVCGAERRGDLDLETIWED